MTFLFCSTEVRYILACVVRKAMSFLPSTPRNTLMLWSGKTPKESLISDKVSSLRPSWMTV